MLCRNACAEAFVVMNMRTVFKSSLLSTSALLLPVCLRYASYHSAMLFPEQLVQVGARTEFACAFSAAIVVFAFERDFCIVVSFRKEL